MKRAGRQATLGGAAVLAALLLPASAPAQTAASPPAPTVDEIVAKHLAARGGREALAAVKTLRMSGRATAGPGREAVLRREIARPGKIRTEFVFQGTTGVYAWDGSQGWRVSPLDGSLDAEPLPDDEAAASAEQADIEGPLVDWKAKGNRVELAGFEQVGGKNAYRLKITLKDGSERYDYIDETTYRHVRTDVDRELRGLKVHTSAIFSGHRMQGGVLFPTVVEMSAVGRPQKLRVVVDKIEVNPKIPASRFERAAGAPKSP